MTPAEKFAAALRMMNEACKEIGVPHPLRVSWGRADSVVTMEAALKAGLPEDQIGQVSRWMEVEGVSLRYHW